MSFLDDVLPLPVEQVELERFRFGAQVALSEYFAIPTEVRRYEDHALRHLCYQIIQEVVGQRLDRVVTRYPADWWQGFKARWFPARLKRRWPVREQVVEVDIAALYPKIAIPRERLYIHVWRRERLETLVQE